MITITEKKYNGFKFSDPSITKTIDPVHRVGSHTPSGYFIWEGLEFIVESHKFDYDSDLNKFRFDIKSLDGSGLIKGFMTNNN